MHKINCYILFILFSCILSLQGCTSECDYANCTEDRLGVYPLNNSSFDWFPFGATDTMVVYNDQGFRDTLISEKIQQAEGGTVVQVPKASACCVRSYNYYNGDVLARSYAGELINIYISLQKYSVHVLKASAPDSLDDGLLVRVNLGQARFPLTDSLLSKGGEHYERLNTLTWGGKTYADVVHFKPYESGWQNIKGLYYSKADGLIGFYKSNGEKWYVE